MAGHSKWKNIQHRKGSQDAKRGKLFTKITVEIIVAAKHGGGNQDDNPKLRAALTKAKAVNMPKDNWQKAIKKGTGEIQSSDYIEKKYEGYGPGGVAFFVECLTDNINRTVGDVRHAFSRSGGNLGQDGSVAWIFDQKGIIIYDIADIIDTNELFEDSINHGAEDVEITDQQIIITSTPEKFSTLKTFFIENIKATPIFCEITRVPKNTTKIETDIYSKVERLVEVLESNEDIQNVFHNGECEKLY